MTLHTGVFAPTPALWRASSSYRPVRAMAVRKCLKCCQLFSCISCACAFVRGMMHFIFSGPIELPSGGKKLGLAQRAGSSGISWRILSLVKKTLHRHRAGFESQRASPFMKWVKAPQILGEAVRACTMAPLFVLPFTLLEVLASSSSGDQHFCEIVTLCRPTPHQKWVERDRLVTASFAMTRAGAQLGKQLPGKWPRETAET